MSNVNLIESWVAHFNSKDLDAIIDLYSEEAALHLAFGPRVESRVAIRGMFEEYFNATALHCEVESLYGAEGGRVVLQWRDTVGLLGCNVYTIREGRIVAQMNYFDQMSFFRLNGLPVPST